jgi:hypothetical protein
MNAKFQSLVESLEPQYLRLVEMAPVRYGALSKHLPMRAIYLFSEVNRHLYVGRTNNLRNRLRGHCSAASNHFSAVFAFRLAREATGFMKATYRTEGSRASLSADPVFGPAFARARQRVAQMDIRFVEEVDPINQALLELYTATTLETQYNDFENH